MILVGLSWLFYWLLVDTFTVEAVKAVLVTGFVFVVVGLLVDHWDGIVKLRRPQ